MHRYCRCALEFAASTLLMQWADSKLWYMSISYILLDHPYSLSVSTCRRHKWNRPNHQMIRLRRIYGKQFIKCMLYHLSIMIKLARLDIVVYADKFSAHRKRGINPSGSESIGQSLNSPKFYDAYIPNVFPSSYLTSSKGVTLGREKVGSVSCDHHAIP